jgi:hypothetical protein
VRLAAAAMDGIILSLSLAHKKCVEFLCPWIIWYMRSIPARMHAHNVDDKSLYDMNTYFIRVSQQASERQQQQLLFLVIMQKLKGGWWQHTERRVRRVKRGDGMRVEMCIINKITIQSVRQRLIEAHKNVYIYKTLHMSAARGCVRRWWNWRDRAANQLQIALSSHNKLPLSVP